MAIRPHLPLDERLLILRSADKFRKWNSLDDQRVCILCYQKFSGRQVEVSRSRSGDYHIHCPTDGCNASVVHWVYPGNPLLSEAAYADWQRTLIGPEASAAA